MLLHIVYLGTPTEKLIKNSLELLKNQRDSDRISTCHHPRGKLWTLNSLTQTNASNILARLQPLEPQEHPEIHLEILSATSLLYAATKAPITRYVSEKDSRRTQEERKASASITQMLSDYFRIILNSESLIGGANGRVTYREFVTGKELLALWIAYTYGGVIMDAGCECENKPWGFEDLNPNNFYVPRIPAVGPLEGVLVPLDLKTKVVGDIRLSYKWLYMSQLWVLLEREQVIPRALFEAAHHTFSICHTSNIDNWIIISPALHLVSLYALRTFVLLLPYAYVSLQNHQKDSIFEIVGEFAQLSATVSANAIVNGFYQNAASHPGLQNGAHLRSNGRAVNLDLALTTLDARENPPRYILSSGIIKNVTQPKRINGIVVEGWRVMLNPEQARAVCERFSVLMNIWQKSLGNLTDEF